MKKHYRAENDCLNCGATLQGKFCSVCGQENLEIKESFGHLMNHAVSDYFHFDDKFFNTLKPLLFKPGKLTNEYMAGKRVSYLHPVKMYIFISLVYFLLVFNGKNNLAVFKDNPKTKKEVAGMDKNIISNTYYTVQQKNYLVSKINQYQVIKKDGNKADTVYSYADNHHITSAGDTSYTQYLSDQQKLSPDKRDGAITIYIEKKQFEWNKQGTDTAKIMEETYEHSLPKMMFLLLPLFALILKIVFSKNRKFYVEHLIYAFHFHCFLFLFLSVMILIQLIIPISWVIVTGWLNFISFIAVVWYLYRSLRVVYNRSPGKTIIKMIGVSFWYSTTLFLGIVLLAAISAIIAV